MIVVFWILSGGEDKSIQMPAEFQIIYENNKELLAVGKLRRAMLLGSGGAIKPRLMLMALLDVLADESSSLDLVATAFMVLKRVMDEVEGLEEEQLLQVLVTVLRRKQVSDEVLIDACEVLGVVGEKFRRLAGQTGAVGALVALLRRPAISDNLLLTACRTLQELTVDQNAREAGVAGGVEALVGLIKAEKTSQSLMLMAIFTLRNIVFDLDNKRLAIQEGAIEALVYQLERWEASEFVLAGACDSLAILAEDIDAAQRAGLVGGIEAVIDVLRRPMSLAYVKLYATDALRLLVVEDEDNAAAAAQAGGIPVLLSVLGQLASSEDLALRNNRLDSGWIALCALVESRSTAEEQFKAMEGNTTPVDWDSLAHLCTQHRAELNKRVCALKQPPWETSPAENDNTAPAENMACALLMSIKV